MKIANQWVRVYVTKGYWEAGVLKRYFECDLPDGQLPAFLFFWCDNCEYEPVSNTYKIRLELLNSSITEEVYIPREYVSGIAVQENKSSPDEQKRKIGFVASGCK